MKTRFAALALLILAVCAVPASAQVCAGNAGTDLAFKADTDSVVQDANFFTVTLKNPTGFRTACNGVSWTASTSAGWLTLGLDGVNRPAPSSSVSSTGSWGSVDVFPALNTSGVARSAAVTVSFSNGQPSKTITVTQDGALAASCTYALSPSSLSVPRSAITYTITVTTQAGCTWGVTTSSHNSFNVSKKGTGSGTFTMFFGPFRNSELPEAFVLTSGGQTLAVGLQ
jgi:hypothetical protein